MQKLFYAAVPYMVLGVEAGLFYREFTKANDLPEGTFTQLAVVHTHRVKKPPKFHGNGDTLSASTLIRGCGIRVRSSEGDHHS